MAQEEQITTAPVPTPTKQVSMTPEESRSAASALWSSMITSAPQQPGAGTFYILPFKYQAQIM